MKELISTMDLERGMYVAELDRPWLETPFLLQGFLIDDDDQVLELRKYCSYVYIDRSRSIGRHFSPRADQTPYRHQRPADAPVVRVVKVLRDAPQKLPDFFEVLRIVREEDAAGKARLAAALPPPARRPGAIALQSSSGKLRTGAAAGEKEAATAQEIADRMRDRRIRGGDPGPGLFDYAASWLKPVADWFREPLPETDMKLARELAERDKPQARSDAIILVYEDQSEVEEEVLRASPVYERTQTVVQQLVRDLETNRKPDLVEVRASMSGMVDSVVRNPDALVWLNKLKRTDQYSYDHALDVSVYLLVFGRYLGLPEMHLSMVGTAGLMQDLGKSRLPPELLHKTGKLTAHEYDLFKTHVDLTLEILATNTTVSLDLVDMVMKHHERYDGSGYPNGLKGAEVGLYAEMAGLVDSYCAMTRDKPYRAARTNQEALEQINAMRDLKFSGHTVDQFIQCVGLYPVGTLVELNSGEVAVVIAQNRIRRLQPRIMVLLGPDKSRNRYPPTFDLLYDPPSPTGEPYRIVRSLPPNAHGIDPREFYLA